MTVDLSRKVPISGEELREWEEQEDERMKEELARREEEEGKKVIQIKNMGGEGLRLWMWGHVQIGGAVPWGISLVRNMQERRRLRVRAAGKGWEGLRRERVNLLWPCLALVVGWHRGKGRVDCCASIAHANAGRHCRQGASLYTL